MHPFFVIIKEEGDSMEYKGIIFDFNGTLFFDNDKHVKAWNEISYIIRKKGISDKELYTQFNGTPNESNIRYLTNDQVTKEEIEKYSKLKEEYYRKFCKEDVEYFHLVDGVIEYFEYLKQQEIPFTIASASIKENIDFFIDSFTLDKWIEPSTIIYDNGKYINKIEMFKDASKVLGVPIEEILVFEDSYSGIHSAYQAGVKNIIVVCNEDTTVEFQNMPGVVKVIKDFKGYKEW